MLTVYISKNSLYVMFSHSHPWFVSCHKCAANVAIRICVMSRQPEWFWELPTPYQLHPPEDAYVLMDSNARVRWISSRLSQVMILWMCWDARYLWFLLRLTVECTDLVIWNIIPVTLEVSYLGSLGAREARFRFIEFRVKRGYLDLSRDLFCVCFWLRDLALLCACLLVIWWGRTWDVRSLLRV